MMLHTSRQCSTTRPTGSRRRTKQEVTDKQSKVNYTGAVMRRAGQNTKFVVSNAFSRALRCPVPVGAGSGSKGWWRPSDTQNTQHIARLGREVQPEPAKEGRKGADDLTGGEVWDRGFDSLPWHHRSDAHDSTTSEFLIRREVAYLPQGRKPDKWRFESSSGHQTQ